METTIKRYGFLPFDPKVPTMKRFVYICSLLMLVVAVTMVPVLTAPFQKSQIKNILRQEILRGAMQNRAILEARLQNEDGSIPNTQYINGRILYNSRLQNEDGSIAYKAILEAMLQNEDGSIPNKQNEDGSIPYEEFHWG